MQKMRTTPFFEEAGIAKSFDRNKTGDFKLKPRRFLVALLWLIGSASFGQQMSNAPYWDPNLSPEQRATDIVSRMTLEEKVLQMQSTAPAIPRLGVPRITGGMRHCTA
jgi:hypothetical protein